MRWIKLALALVCLLGPMSSDQAWAHGGRHGHPRARIGVFIGAPLVWHWYYPPYYYYPPIVAAPSPPAYIERGDDATPPAQSPGYWYFCDSPRGYYPYVRDCPPGWQRIPLAPPE